MQVGRIVRQPILQPDPHHVAKPYPQQRRNVGVVIKKARELEFPEAHVGLAGCERDVEDAVPAADFRRLD
jgi:hypothetical protein